MTAASPLKTRACAVEKLNFLRARPQRTQELPDIEWFPTDLPGEKTQIQRLRNANRSRTLAL